MTQPSLFDLAEAQPASTTVASVKPAAKVKPAAMQPHVKRRLEAMGIMDPHTGATRRAGARHCDVCRQPVMRGITRDFGGISIDCDPTPITAAGELLHLLRVAALAEDDRPAPATYELSYHGHKGYRLDGRDSGHIRMFPPGTAGIDVLATHLHYAPALPEMHTNVIDGSAATVLPDQPPF